MMLELLRELVEIPSPSGREDRLIEFITDRYNGFEIVEGYGVRDLIMNPDADLWVITHLDTVPVKRRFEFDGVYAYGTGVCDTKGSITAILSAIETINKPKFGVALLSDEEEGGRGSKLFVERFEPARAIVMEPTLLKIANVHYGCLEVLAKFRGVSAHGATPEFGVNAIELAVQAIIRLKEMGLKFLVQKIVGGWDKYAVPDECEVRMDFTFPPDVDPDELEVRIRGILGEFDVLEKDRGFESGDVADLLKSAVEMSGMTPEFGHMPSWTDAINLRKAGWDVVVFGPGELHLCHTEKERIALREIELARDVLVSLNELL